MRFKKTPDTEAANDKDKASKPSVSGTEPKPQDSGKPDDKKASDSTSKKAKHLADDSSADSKKKHSLFGHKKDKDDADGTSKKDKDKPVTEIPSGKGYGQPKTKKGKKHAKAAKVGLWIVCIIGVILMVLGSGAGIAGLFVGAQDAMNTNKTWQDTGGIAAVVMGDNVMEDTITDHIMSARDGKSDADWAQYLVDNDETPEGLRSEAIANYKSSIILRHAMSEYGLSYNLTDTDVDKWWDANGSSLESYGLTKDTAKSYYADTIRQWILEQAVVPTDSISDQDVLDYINENASTYNGARKSSHILFASDTDGSTTNKDTAESVLQQIKDGSLSFEDAVAQYSTDTTSQQDNGNVGWDCETSFVSDYENALKNLNDGDISDVVQSSYGYHIIKCTGVFSWDDTLTDISAVPDEILTSVKTALQQEKFQEWYQSYTENADVTINDMPDNLPYMVSLDGVTKSANANNSSTYSTTTTTVDADNENADSTSSSESSDSSDASSSESSSDSSDGSVSVEASGE